MLSPEQTIHTPSGAIYVAEVHASLPAQSVVGQAYLNTRALHEMQAAWPTSLSEHMAQYQIAADIRTPEGALLVHDDPDFSVIHYDQDRGFALLQAFPGDSGEETFSALFSRKAEDEGTDFDGHLGYHTAYQTEAAQYIVPLEACQDSKQHSPAVAILALGREAIEIFQAPEPDQIDAYMAAADVLLRKPAPPLTQLDMLLQQINWP